MRDSEQKWAGLLLEARQFYSKDFLDSPPWIPRPWNKAPDLLPGLGQTTPALWQSTTKKMLPTLESYPKSRGCSQGELDLCA